MTRRCRPDCQRAGSLDAGPGSAESPIPEAPAGQAEIDQLPFAAALPFTTTCRWTYFEFDDALDRDVVHIETHAGFRLLETAESLAHYRRYFDEIRRRSLTTQASRELVRQAIRDIR